MSDLAGKRPTPRTLIDQQPQVYRVAGEGVRYMGARCAYVSATYGTSGGGQKCSAIKFPSKLRNSESGSNQQSWPAYRPNNISPNPSPRMIEIMNEAFCDLPTSSVANRPHSHDTHMTISIRVKCTPFVPSEAIPRGISYLGTNGGSDDKIALSSVGGALATL